MKESSASLSPVVRLLCVFVALATSCPVPMTRADTVPVLEYRMGEDDSPNALGGPATDPSKARTGGPDATRHGAPRYVAGQAGVGSTRAIQLANVAGSPPQFYGTEFDFEPAEANQWGFGCWVKFDSLPDPDRSPEATILHLGDITAGSILLQTFARDGKIKFGTHAPGIAVNVSDVDVHLGRWTHVAVVFDGSGKLYIDGIETVPVGGGQNPPAGFTLGAARFTTGSFGSAANVTLDDVRLFEVPAGTFGPGDLGIPEVTGPFVVSSSGGPLGFTIEIQDNGDSVLDPASLALKVNGTATTPTSITQPGNTLVEVRRAVEDPYPGGVYALEIAYRDTTGRAYTEARSFRVRAYTLLPQAFAATGVNLSTPGFLLRPYQTTNEQPNSLKWTDEQLDGLHGPNLANLAGATGGYFARDGVVDFAAEGVPAGNFPNDASFTELGLQEPADNASLEVVTFVEFPAPGFYTLGVNSDEGFRVSTGRNARDRLGVVLGEYDGDRLAADTTFPIYVPRLGLYPLRLLYENGTGAASVEWFGVLDDGTKVLLNDTATTGALRTFRTGPSPAYVSSVVPVPGEPAASGADGLTVKITDGDTTVGEQSVRLGLNGAVGLPTTVAKAAGVTTATWKPSATLAAGSTNQATLVYTDTSGLSFTNTWSFVVAKQAGAPELITPSGITQKTGDTLGGFPVANLVNNSGFGTPPDLGNFATTTHNASGNTWVTATAANPNYFTTGKPAPVFVLTLGGLYELSQLVVWGYGGNNNEASDFSVEFSTDGGTTFSGSETVATTKLLGGNSAALPFSAAHAANAVRITMTQNAGGRGFSGAGSGDRVGLGEIKFVGRAVLLLTPTSIAQKAGDTLGGFPVANLINNSGFGTPPDAATFLTTTHNASGNTWVTASSAGPNYFTAGRPAPVFVLTLGGTYEPSALVVWGYGGNNNEASDFTVEFSTDGGATFAAGESVQTAKLLGGNAAALPFAAKHQANALRLTMTQNAGGRGFSGAGTGDRVGLGEIKVLATLPEPASQPALAVTRSGGDLVISWPSDANGFVLESSDRLSSPVWTPVGGVANNRVTVTPDAGTRFYRLHKP
jgi:hypothetical protein